MSKILNLLAPFRSQIFAMIGVLAVCGLGAAVIAYAHIKQQDRLIAAQQERAKELVAVNASWAKYADQQAKLRALEQQNVTLLQDKLALIEAQNAAAADQLKALEASNAEVREYMSRPIPAGLRRLLEQR